MDFIRRYLFELACGVVGVAGIVAGAIAYTGYSDIRAELSDAANVARQLEQYRGPGSLCNKQVIDAEQQRNALVDRQLEQVTEAAKQMNQHQPLRDDVFPEPPAPIRTSAPFLFRTDYRERFKQLLDMLQAGDAPDQQEIQDMQDRITQEQRIPEDQALGLGPSVSVGRPTVKPGDEYMAPRPGAGSWGAGEAEVSIEELARTDAAIRAALVKAARIRIYASLASFDIVDDVYIQGAQPTLTDMWYAQVKLWVQENVIRGLAEVNEQAAERIEAEGGRPSVTNLPAKHLLTMSVTDYVEASAVGATGAAGKGGSIRSGLGFMSDAGDAMKMGGSTARGGSRGSSGRAVASFTERTSNELYDVVQCRVEMVVDARELLRVVSAICRQDFITPIGVSFEAMEPNTAFTDYIYGSAPVVQATVDFECCFFRELYDPLTPEDVKTMRGMAAGGSSSGGRPMYGK